MEVYRAIESGDACERFAPVLAALAGGTATSAEIVEIRPHLRHCLACRATVRDLHIARHQRFRLLLPEAVLALLGWGRSKTEPPEPPPPELILEQSQDAPERVQRLRPGRLWDELSALFNRANSSDVAAGIHIATAGGGGRISALAAMIGFCVSGVGAGALCVATGVVQAPGWIIRDEAKPAKPPRAKAQPAELREPSRVTASARSTEVVVAVTPQPTPAPTVKREPARRSDAGSRARARDPSQGTAPRSHESAPIAEAPPEAVAEFSIEQSAPAADPAPEPAPATGGGEFTP